MEILKKIRSMLMSKIGYIYHPVGAAAVAFIVGLLLMWLIGKHIIPTGTLNLGICPCK